MKSFGIVIVGAGPGGMAAAIAARKEGKSVAVIDDNHAPGGQIWRGGGGSAAAFTDSGAQFLSGARVIDADAKLKCLKVEAEGAVSYVQYSKLILATGARELFLPFPGWTLPNVFGVGGLQALAKSGLSVNGKRVIVAGSGPLLLAVAAHLKQNGAKIFLVAEQASWSKLRNFSKTLLQHPSKLLQGIKLRASILSTRYLPNCWVTKASGDKHVETVTLIHRGNTIQEQCDYLAVSYGFVPSTELPQLLGCVRDGAGFVKVDDQQQTSIKDVYCVGEPTGLGGVDKSVLEGEIAGRAAAGKAAKWDRRRVDHFTEALSRAFILRPELRAAVTPETFICRCEDVTYKRLQEAASWREAKLHFRCGMGPCQGRVCGPAVNYLFGWQPDSVRPPIFPATVQNLINLQETIHS